MDKAKIMPVDVVRSRINQLIKEREEISIDLEKDIEESKERRNLLSTEVSDIIREDQDYWRTEIYKYDFCIDELLIIEKILLK